MQLSKSFQSANHLRIARSARCAEHGAKARTLLSKVKTVTPLPAKAPDIAEKIPTNPTTRQKGKRDAELLLPLTTALKASLEAALEYKNKHESKSKYNYEMF